MGWPVFRSRAGMIAVRDGKPVILYRTRWERMVWRPWAKTRQPTDRELSDARAVLHDFEEMYGPIEAWHIPERNHG